MISQVNLRSWAQGKLLTFFKEKTDYKASHVIEGKANSGLNYSVTG